MQSVLPRNRLPHLPRRVERDLQTEPERATMADMSNEHILLIDDDLRLSAMVGDYLRVQGYQVSSAASLASGRELLARQAFDALPQDVGLRQLRASASPAALLHPSSHRLTGTHQRR